MELKVSVKTLEDLWMRNQLPQIVDVRSGTEFRAGHLPQACNIPLEELESRIEDLDRSRPLLLVCQSGQRAELASDRLAKHGIGSDVLEGGTKAWRDAGWPLVRSSRTGWSLERQVRLAAGWIVLTGVALSLTLGRGWISLAAVVGLGLTFAGFTDICGMARLLARMPWNAVRSSGCSVNAGTEGRKGDLVAR